MKVSAEPVFYTQLDAFGNQEKVDVTKYSMKVLCAEPGCMQLRYVLPQDRLQSEYCKPHARKHRLAYRAAKAKEKRAREKQPE